MGMSATWLLIYLYNLPMLKMKPNRLRFNAISVMLRIARPVTLSRVCFALILSMLVISATGCSADKAPMQGLVEAISPETPGQVARDAFNVYDADVRRESVNKLAAAKFGGEPPYLRLYRLLIDDPDPTVRAACTKALGLHGEAQDVKLLIPRARDEATAVRWEAAKALQKLHDPAAIDPLSTMLVNDEDPDVRQAAATALGQYATIAVYNQLVGALDDHSYSVVDSARNSLVTLTGYDFGTSGADWLIFANKNSQARFDQRKQYTWQPFVKPRTFWNKMQFWKKRAAPPEPQIPRGMEPLISVANDEVM